MLNADTFEVRSVDPEPDDPDFAAATRALEELRQDWQEFRNAAPTAEQITALNRRLDELERRSQRPGAVAAATRTDDQAELETRAFASYLRSGREALGADEARVLSVGSDGAIVPDQFVRELLRDLVLFSPMRQLARISTASGSKIAFPRRTGTLSAGWVAEGDPSGTSEPTYGAHDIDVFEARVYTDISNQLLEDSAFDMSGELSRDFAEEFGRLEGAAFVGGNGTTQPQGFLTSGDFVSTPGTADLADDLIDLFHAVSSAYASRGNWVMNRASMDAVRKLKTSGAGVYLWTESLAPGNPPTILGRPVVEFPDMETVGANPAGVSIAFGDWTSGYRIFDRIGLSVLRDPYSRSVNSEVRFHARRRVAGHLVKGQAVAGLSA